MMNFSDQGLATAIDVDCLLVSWTASGHGTRRSASSLTQAAAEATSTRVPISECFRRLRDMLLTAQDDSETKDHTDLKLGAKS